MSVHKKTQGTTAEEVTDGIDIDNWTVKADNGVEISYSIWDFAGQTLYYNIHQVGPNGDKIIFLFISYLGINVTFFSTTVLYFENPI